MGCGCTDAAKRQPASQPDRRSGPFNPNLYQHDGKHAQKGAKLYAVEPVKQPSR